MNTVYRQKGFECRSLGAMQGHATKMEERRGTCGGIGKQFEIKTVDCISEINTDPLFVLGSVEFLENYIGHRKPDYYPEWSKNFWRRDIIVNSKFSDYTDHLDNVIDMFVKPSDKYKRFEGVLSKTGFCVETTQPPFDISEVVNFVDEWRYFVANGKVICSWWYKGSDETCEKNPHGPSIAHMDIPKDFCGAVDMGILDTGELALVEVQHPYAIGWYGENDTIEDYFTFLRQGFEYLKYN
jgi:hypothetical protein